MRLASVQTPLVLVCSIPVVASVLCSCLLLLLYLVEEKPLKGIFEITHSVI